jgi:hypothetical protein
MKKKTFLNGVLTALMFLCTVNVSAQTSPEVLKDWTALEEAEFHFDVSYSIVKCTSNSKTMVILNAFNEDGTHPKVGFTLKFSDDKGNSEEVIVKPFATRLGDMFIGSCDSNEHANLRFEYPNNVDLSTLKIEITYQTGS